MRETFLNPRENERARALHAKIDALVEWWKADVYEPPSPTDELRTKVRVAGAAR
jgi:hypothetical protein